MSPVANCAHVIDNGTVCKSPALGDHKYCFFHLRLHQRPKRRNDGSVSLILHDLTCVEGIQIAVSNVLHATNDGLIDSKTANSLYRGLRMALSALRLKLAQQKYEASQNREDSDSRPRGRDHFSNFLSLCDSAFSSTDGSRSPSSDQPAGQPECGADIPVRPQAHTTSAHVPTNPAPSPVILTASEASRKDLCTSADTTNPAAVHQAADGSIPHPIPSSSDYQLTPVLPEQKVKSLKQILRKGPRHPLYHSAAQQLDKHTAAVANSRNELALCGD